MAVSSSVTGGGSSGVVFGFVEAVSEVARVSMRSDSVSDSAGTLPVEVSAGDASVVVSGEAVSVGVPDGTVSVEPPRASVVINVSVLDSEMLYGDVVPWVAASVGSLVVDVATSAGSGSGVSRAVYSGWDELCSLNSLIPWKSSSGSAAVAELTLLDSLW